MADVKVYTTPTCPWCKKTKKFLEEKDVDYEEFYVAEDEDAAAEMMEVSGQRGVPVTVVGDDVVVGFDKDRLEQVLSV